MSTPASGFVALRKSIRRIRWAVSPMRRFKDARHPRAISSQMIQKAMYPQAIPGGRARVPVMRLHKNSPAAVATTLAREKRPRNSPTHLDRPRPASGKTLPKASAPRATSAGASPVSIRLPSNPCALRSCSSLVHLHAHSQIKSVVSREPHRCRGPGVMKVSP